jgi:hypothetical protein
MVIYLADLFFPERAFADLADLWGEAWNEKVKHL